MAVISWTLQNFPNPAGTAGAAIVVTATDANGAITTGRAAPTDNSINMALLPGTYTVSAHLVDASGASIGPVASDPSLVVTAPIVQIPVNVTAAP